MSVSQNHLAPLQIEGLKKRWDDFILEAHFTVGVGERVALLGKSGSGKSTLLRLIAGLEFLRSHDEGRILLGHQDMTHLPPQARHIGFIFQDSALFSYMNVLDNVTFGLKMRGISRQDRESQARTWLEKVGLQSKANSSVTHLSGGEKQRVAFIRALIWKPRLLLLDEPFSALDPDLRNVLRNELVELHRLWPAPLLWVTHDPSDLKTVATRSLRLEQQPDSIVRKIMI